MLKRWLALAAACVLLPAAALADAWEGVTMVKQTVAIEAPSTGVLEQLGLRVGQALQSGEDLGQIRPNRVYAAQDATVARIQTKAGEKTDSTVLELSPMSPYLVYCTIDKYYISNENKVIHPGEVLYVRCSGNGTHRAVGYVHHVSGNEYQLELTAGELYVGEVVDIYRDRSMNQQDRVGAGTVVTTLVEPYTAAGYVQQLRVAEGDTVERGQLLYTWTDGETQQIVCPADGVVTAVTAAKGASVKKESTVAEMAAYADILLEIQVTRRQAASMAEGDPVTYTRGIDPSEASQTGRVVYIAAVPENDTYTVRIQPDVPETTLGMTVQVVWNK